MALAVKHVPVHNLPPYLSYFSTLPEITQKPKHDIDKLKQWHLESYYYYYYYY